MKRLSIALLDEDRPTPSDRRRLLALQRGPQAGPFEPGRPFDVLVTADRRFRRWLPIVKESKERGARVVFDVSDDILAGAPSRAISKTTGVERALQGLKRLARKTADGAADAFFRLCDGIVAGSDEQAESFLKRYPGKPVLALVDPVDFAEFKHQRRHENVRPATVVWEGTAENVPYLEVCAKPLRELMDCGEIGLRVVSDRRRRIGWKGMKDNREVLRSLGLAGAQFVDWELATFSRQLADGDIAIAPLFLDDPFARSKPENKLLGYAATRLPVVASPVPSYRRLLGACPFGFLAATEAEWLERVRRLGSDHILREELGRRGRELVEREHTVEAFCARYRDFLHSL